MQPSFSPACVRMSRWAARSVWTDSGPLRLPVLPMVLNARQRLWGMRRYSNRPTEKGAEYLPNSFAKLGVSTRLMGRLEEAGITVPTPIQAKGIPTIRAGHSVLLQSPTGTGKTLAWLLPLTQWAERRIQRPYQALVLVPSRELGNQILSEAHYLLDTPSTPAIGTLYTQPGMTVDMGRLLQSPPCVLIATPKAALHLLQQRWCPKKLREVGVVVMEEVDQLLRLPGRYAQPKAEKRRIIHPSATEQLLDLLAGTEPHDNHMATFQRQFICASATINNVLRHTIKTKGWITDPQHLVVTDGPPIPPAITHRYRPTMAHLMIDTLLNCLAVDNPKSALIFLPESAPISQVVDKLKSRGLNAVPLYKELGDPDTTRRNAFLEQLRQGEVVGVSTEATMRGLDFPFVSHVYVLGAAASPRSYIHLAGRTGRMGRTGHVISILEDDEQSKYVRYCRYLDIEPDEWYANTESAATNIDIGTPLVENETQTAETINGVEGAVSLDGKVEEGSEKKIDNTATAHDISRPS